jgi:hypothetical protein
MRERLLPCRNEPTNCIQVVVKANDRNPAFVFAALFKNEATSDVFSVVCGMGTFNSGFAYLGFSR